MDKLLTFIEQLVDTPYIWWKDGESTTEKMVPFYCKPSTKIPSIPEIRNSGMNCAGFINLLCRISATPIPGIAENNYYAGGTYVWYEYLDSKGFLKPVSIDVTYPVGTLLLSRYNDVENQGHFAVVTTPGTFQTLKISHSYPEKGLQMNEPVQLSHNWIPEGYYTETCSPENWLFPK
jgi:hypothetical protein